MIQLPVLFFCCMLYGAIAAQVTLPRLISDSMILQRDIKVKVWGWASPFEAIQ